jgi:hypothetical protein
MYFHMGIIGVEKTVQGATGLPQIVRPEAQKTIPLLGDLIEAASGSGAAGLPARGDASFPFQVAEDAIDGAGIDRIAGKAILLQSLQEFVAVSFVTVQQEHEARFQEAVYPPGVRVRKLSARAAATVIGH